MLRAPYSASRASRRVDGRIGSRPLEGARVDRQTDENRQGRRRAGEHRLVLEPFVDRDAAERGGRGQVRGRREKTATAQNNAKRKT